MQRASSVGATSLMYIMQNSVCPPCGGGTLKCSCRKELGDQLQLVRSMLGEIAERSDTCHTMTDVTTIGDLRCECACGVQLVPETSAALFIKRTRPRILPLPALSPFARSPTTSSHIRSWNSFTLLRPKDPPLAADAVAARGGTWRLPTDL